MWAVYLQEFLKSEMNLVEDCDWTLWGMVQEFPLDLDLSLYEQ